MHIQEHNTRARSSVRIEHRAFNPGVPGSNLKDKGFQGTVPGGPAIISPLNFVHERCLPQLIFRFRLKSIGGRSVLAFLSAKKC